mmetsp:Transcript_41812/g.126816  ORF Transcript_41812/g.126816 Transcript_41812/m.126816 type:complete len:98 (+) Transcript_41812:283-576(+)|eukprot:CAMPEP_0113531708 /NCGR_PEP_ID=MMETSP0015_2-20120614/3643_1 /TAXON_ID=2838 /ORGANISM="Odontella" /LENGTH=97 /DNA_ID=CAMNT_0000430567 /DNA_START=234 /DNA_END=527 /DNA_ORIENTATION=+ /assembly_acc=CAM_ASM_000160
MIDVLELEIANARLELDQVRLDARTKLQEQKALQNLRGQLVDENNSLSEELEALQEKTSEATRERDSLREVTERLAAENTALVAELDHLRAERDKEL